MRRQRNTTRTRQLFKFMEKKVGCRGSELSDDVNLTSQKKKPLYSPLDLTGEQVTKSFVFCQIV